MTVERCPTCGQALPAGLSRANLLRKIEDNRQKAISSVLAKERKEIQAKALERARQELKPTIVRAQDEGRRQARKELEKLQQQLTAEQARRRKAEAEALEKARKELMPTITKAREEERRQTLQEMTELQKRLALEQSRRQKAEETAKKLERQLSTVSPQDRGPMTQREVAQLIRAACPEDNVSEIAKGQRGGDVLQEARDKGHSCGKILWEVKDTVTWSDEYLDKAKADGRRGGAEYVVIATRSFPRGIGDLAVRKGVVLVNPQFAGSLANLLHHALVELAEARLATTQRAAKAAKILDYIASPECKSRFDAITEGVAELRRIQELERNYHDTHWSKEERIMAQIATASSGIREALQAIARETPVKLAAQALSDTPAG